MKILLTTRTERFDPVGCSVSNIYMHEHCIVTTCIGDACRTNGDGAGGSPDDERTSHPIRDDWFSPDAKFGPASTDGVCPKVSAVGDVDASDDPVRPAVARHRCRSQRDA